MANYCDYEIHVKGSKKATLFLYSIMPAYDYKEITHEEGTEDNYIVWMEGNCKWSLDNYCEENPDVKIDLDNLSESDIRNEDNGLDYWYLTMRQKSEVLGVEILAHSWSDESEFDVFEVYKNGQLVNQTAKKLDSYYEWDKDEFPDYEEFCEEYGIDPEELPESEFENTHDNIFEHYPSDDENSFSFDF